jgi:hypothetical protein
MTSEPDASTDLPDSAEVAATFIELTGAVTGGADAVEVFTILSERCVELLPVAACGVLVVDNSGTLEVVGASDSSAFLLDLFQIQNDEGPCLECFRSGQVVRDGSLSFDGPWPHFAEATRAYGFSSVDAIPLRARSTVLGALNLFGTTPLTEAAMEIATALADTATMALLQADPRIDAATVARQLHLAVESRNTLEQAKGVLAERFGCTFDEATAEMRRVSGLTSTRLLDVARSIVDRDERSEAASILRARQEPPAP